MTTRNWEVHKSPDFGDSDGLVITKKEADKLIRMFKLIPNLPSSSPITVFDRGVQQDGGWLYMVVMGRFVDGNDKEGTWDVRIEGYTKEQVETALNH